MFFIFAIVQTFSFCEKSKYLFNLTLSHWIEHFFSPNGIYVPLHSLTNTICLSIN